jgi:hypothetical protein
MMMMYRRGGTNEWRVARETQERMERVKKKIETKNDF